MPKSSMPTHGRQDKAPRPINQDREPWEKQKGESTQAFEAFGLYRDMGESRSLSKVGHQLNKSKALMGRWSTKWQWVNRALAWDAELDRVARQEQINQVKKMYRKHAKLAQGLLGVATHEINALVKKVNAGHATEVSHKNLIRLIEVATKLERISLGEPVDIFEERRNVEESKTSEHIYRIIADPAASALAEQLLQRAAAAGIEQGDPSMVGLHGQRRAVAPISARFRDEPEGP